MLDINHQFIGHNSWTTQHGVLLMGSTFFELLPFSDQSQVIEFVNYKTRRNANAGRYLLEIKPTYLKNMRQGGLWL